MAGRSLKSAPRREVLEIVKIGDWGEIEYLHRLSCGHTSKRKRQSSASHIACEGCVIAEEFAKSGAPVARRVDDSPSLGSLPDVMHDELGSVEAEAQRIAAGLAARFRVPTEAVDVAISAQGERAEIAYAVVFLDAATARRLSSDLTDVSRV